MPLLKFPKAAQVAHRRLNNVNSRPQVCATMHFQQSQPLCWLSAHMRQRGPILRLDVGTLRTELPKRQNTQIHCRVLAFGTYVEFRAELCVVLSASRSRASISAGHCRHLTPCTCCRQRTFPTSLVNTRTLRAIIADSNIVSTATAASTGGAFALASAHIRMPALAETAPRAALAAPTVNVADIKARLSKRLTFEGAAAELTR